MPAGLKLGEVTRQQIGDFPRGLEAVLWSLGQEAIHDVHQPFWQLGIGFADGPRRSVANTLEDGHRTVRPEGTVAGAQGVEYAAEAEKIGAMIDWRTLRLFGRHVHGRTGDQAALRQARVIDRAGEAEIRELDTLDAVLQQDVAGFDVAVD